MPVLFYYAKIEVNLRKNMQKRTKIVATLGPASESKETLKQMIEAGMNVARINFSHSDHKYNGGLIKKIQELREEMGVPVGIMADLQGPRIRVMVEQDVEIKKGENILVSDIGLSPNFKFEILNFKLNSNDQIFNDRKKILLDQPGIVKNLQVGDAILIEDGKIRLKVIKKEEGFAEAEAEEGGVVKNHKGVNLPDTKLELSALTEKDEKDLEFALSQEVEYVAMSFVSQASEIEDLRTRMKEILKRDNDLPWIVAKIERKKAIENLEEIIKATDIVMVARGDLGIELPESEVAILQKDIIGKCLQNAKPVIVATQMMDSMIENPIPTRAEVSDVTNAVVDHVDATMLSGESANGKFPVETVKMMAEVIEETEKSKYDDSNKIMADLSSLVNSEEIKKTIEEMKNSPESEFKLTDDDGGRMAIYFSNQRIEKTLQVATKSKKLYNQFSVVWGVEAV